MVNRKKKTYKRFGLPSGRFRVHRKSKNIYSGNKSKTYGCNAGEGLRLKIFKKRSLSSFTRRRINLLRKHLNSSDRVFRATDGSLKSSNYKSCNLPASGYRLISIQKLQQHYHDIANHVVFCDKARDIAVRGGNMVEIISQPANYGLATTLQARCSGCQQKLSFDTSPRLETNASRHFDVNVRAVWGALASGNGLAHLNEVLATLDSPTMSQNTFTTIENEISQWWKDLLQEDFSQAIAEGKKNSYCKGASNLKVDAKEHECFKNWDKSSQAMEADIIVEGFFLKQMNMVFDHSRCSDFCKANLKDKSSAQAHEAIDNDDTENIFDEQSCFWNEGTSNDALEESRLSSHLSITDLMSCMRQDLSLILSRVAKKSASLLGNFTSNLAEMWMHVRTKYDGGKIYNHCNRGSWHNRCYAASLRFNKGIQWSPQTWEETTSSVSGHYYTTLYSKRLQCLKNNTKTKGKKEIKSRRYKRKIKSAKESTAASSKKHYGPEAIQVEADISSEELDKRKQQYLKKHIEISHSEIDDIEINTRLQGSCKRWRDERATRLTASNFGLIFKRNPKIPVTPLLNQLLLNSKFYGNSATRHGLSEERITIKEYIQYKLKQNVHVKVERMGLVIDKTHKFLAGSPDGKVTEEEIGKPPSVGLIEIKNVLYRKDTSFTDAVKQVKNFCLELKEKKLQVKRSHNYYYQCQGLLNVCNKPWIDLIVRTTNPYELHVERIFKDSVFWTHQMQPKLSSFFFKAVLPELSAPRISKYPGIREPGIWQQKIDNIFVFIMFMEKDMKEHWNEIKSRRKCSSLKFVGRRISHEWIEDDGTGKWYKGTVTAVIDKNDGDEDAEYENHKEANKIY
ncbi:unnamed protein product [Mytilus edulis]|uniref:YqaJ viral recombinase domain-containing protein n=1 Tax=Mytilus edulis TaxID=6550 RepID=A0A8S3RYU6_MYTED|nr:unnamed protein product [Mytilus edulis]